VTLEQDFRSHYPEIYRYAAKLAGSREDAEDVAQESFLRLEQVVRRGTGPDEPRAWLFRVATNLCRDLHRRKRTRGDGREGLEALRSQSDPAADLAQEERRALARRVLDRLRERDRVLLALWSAGHSHAEIARIAGLRTTSIGRLLERATRRASSLLDQESER
jgi:RNA polymerase sigma-70 factor (ECF subfamily)